jgi:hypothetical protein
VQLDTVTGRKEVATKHTPWEVTIHASASIIARSPVRTIMNSPPLYSYW